MQSDGGKFGEDPAYGAGKLPKSRSACRGIRPASGRSLCLQRRSVGAGSAAAGKLFIYLADGAVDYAHDKKKGSYNPFLAMGMEPDWEKWTEFLVLEMAGCTDAYERLPLVEDKHLMLTFNVDTVCHKTDGMPIARHERAYVHYYMTVDAIKAVYLQQGQFMNGTTVEVYTK